MNARYLFIILSLFTFSVFAVNLVPPINLNKASIKTLTHSFKGIGVKRATAIIAYRKAHGPFKTVEDLANIKGLGFSFVQRNREALMQTYTI